MLYLNGQYLYDYKEIDDDPELNRATQFPCTDFTLRRHRDTRFIVDIVCRGTLVEPEIIFTVEQIGLLFQGRELRDGEILSEMTFDALAARFKREPREPEEM